MNKLSSAYRKLINWKSGKGYIHVTNCLSNLSIGRFVVYIAHKMLVCHKVACGQTSKVLIL